jgi:adenylylsulfate kinase-like enzyme
MASALISVLTVTTSGPDTPPLSIADGEQGGLAGDGVVLWLTGLSGSGKTTVGFEVRRVLEARGIRPVLLDGDRLRAITPTPSA